MIAMTADMIRTMLAPAMVALAMLLAISVAAVPAAAQEYGAGQDRCLSNRQLYQAIEQGSVPNVNDVAGNAGISSNDISGAELCDQGGQWVYKLRLGRETGVGRTLVLPAN